MREQQLEVLYDEIKPGLELYEKGRQEALKKHNYLRSTLTASYTLFIAVIIIFISMPLQLKIMISLPVLAIFWAIKNYYKNKYIKKYKKDLTQLIFGRAGIKMTYEPTDHIYSKYFKQSDLFEYANTFSGDDLIKGEREGLYFLGSELKARYTKSRKNRPDIDKLIFDGFYFCGQVPYDMGTTVTIHSRDFNYISSHQNIPDLKFESLNEEFDQNFQLDYSDYDKTSFLLTPEFMQVLLDFKQKHKHPFVIKVARNQVYLAIQEDKDFFQVHFDTAADSMEHLETLATDSQFFFDLIEIIERIK